MLLMTFFIVIIRDQLQKRVHQLKIQISNFTLQYVHYSNHVK